MTNIVYDPENDCYGILGVDAVHDLNETALRQHYKRLVLKFRSYKQPTGARKLSHNFFVRMQNAYELLTDPSRRRIYYRRRHAYYLNKHFQMRIKISFPMWFQVQERLVWSDENGRTRKFESKLIKKSSKEAEDVKKRDVGLKRRQRGDRQRQFEERESREEEQHEHEKKTKERRRMRVETKYEKNLFLNWKSGQAKKIKNAVNEREIQLKELNEKQEHDRQLQVQTHTKQLESLQKKLESLQKRQSNQQQKLREKQERELLSTMDFQEKERKTQRTKRNRVRDNYNSLILERRKKFEGEWISTQRPTVYTPVYGRRTKDHVHRRNCKLARGFCAAHKHQKRY